MNDCRHERHVGLPARSGSTRSRRDSASTPPDDDTFEALLDLAGVAAHASERIAAPIACWLVGRAGVPVEEARRLAEA